MPRTKFFASLLGLVVIAAACSAAPAVTTTPAGATVAPTTAAATPTVALPTAAATPAPTNPPVAGGTQCAGKPTFSLASPAEPSFAPDPVIEAIFPAQIDGQQAFSVKSFSWIEQVCFFGGQAQVDRLMATSASSALLTNLTLGQASYTIGGNSVELQAFRIPGQDASTIVQNAGLFVAALTGGTPPPLTSTQTTIGGKQVSVLTDSAGTVTYAYPKGDVLLTVNGVDQATAATIFAAFP